MDIILHVRQAEMEALARGEVPESLKKLSQLLLNRKITHKEGSNAEAPKP